MRHYLEITLIPNAEIDRNFLWFKTYQQLHLGLVALQDEHKRVPIGMSFPEYRMGDKFGLLGGKCRLFALDEAALANFNTAKWLERLSDYVHCTGIRQVPDKPKGYAIYQRMQPIASKERLARRYAKRKGISYDAALAHYQDMKDKAIDLPFIRLRSLSSNRDFCLWIRKLESGIPSEGDFSSYGLSRETTVPEF